MDKQSPLASQEVRWFFEGDVNRHQSLKHWFETAKPIPQSLDVGPPEWKERLNNEPDVYLLIPGSDDMGIKWREGKLQIKGRVSALGTQVFSDRHQGNVEHWVKWSYGNLPNSYQRGSLKEQTDLITVSVQKVRALRKIRLDPLTWNAQEVDVRTPIDQGLELELTDLAVTGKRYCSLAFEGSLGGSASSILFHKTVETFLADLKNWNLTAAHSWSYPAWLENVVQHQT